MSVRSDAARLVVMLVLAGMAGLGALAPLPPDVVERLYSEGIYPQLQRAVTPVTNRAPFALLEIFAAGALTWLVWRAVRRLRNTSARGAMLGMAGDVLILASLVYLWFLAAWGLNYRRVSIDKALDFDSSRVDRGAIVRLANRAVFELNRLHAVAHRSPWADFDELRPALVPRFVAARELLGARWHPVPGRAKRSLLDFYFRRSGVDGMTDPLFLEVLVNHEVLGVERPYVLAHEWSHLAGHADEGEAGFVAWLTCVRGGAQYQYSAWLAVYPELTAHVPRDDRETLLRYLGEGPRRDLEAIRNRVARATPFIRRAAWRMYDRYLRANRVEDGAASYARVVQLIAGTRFKPGWVPALAGSRQ